MSNPTIASLSSTAPLEMPQDKGYAALEEAMCNNLIDDHFVHILPPLKLTVNR